MTNVWITSPWTKLITNFLILTCKNAMEFGCSLSLSFLKFLKFANILISSEYCSRKLECALCTMWVSFCYPAPSPARPWECQPLRLTRCSQSLHNRLLLRGQPVQRWGGWGEGLISITNSTSDHKICVLRFTKRHFCKPKSQTPHLNTRERRVW